jgi:phytoene dehydrogenase-like protein
MGGENYWFLGILAAWLAALTILFIFLYRRVAKVFSTEKNPSFDKILDQLIAAVKKNGGEIKKNQEQIKILAKEGQFHIQKIGLVRFNPFSQTGGNQSFSLALLDGNNDGIVISSLHNREETRVYAKIVRKAEAEKEMPFSDEEREAIRQALKK